MAIVWICVSIFVLSLALMLLIMFCCLFKAEKAADAAGKPLYYSHEKKLNAS